MKNLTIRHAKPEDTDLVLRFIKSLSVYEKMEHRVIATRERLHEALFIKKYAEVLLACENSTPVGFALFFSTFSTFQSNANLYLEDLFIDEAYRGKGYGKALLKELSKITLERGYARLDWSCLDWNQPSIDFYEKLGAKQTKEWLHFRLEGNALKTLAK